MTFFVGLFLLGALFYAVVGGLALVLGLLIKLGEWAQERRSSGAREKQDFRDQSGVEDHLDIEEF